MWGVTLSVFASTIVKGDNKVHFELDIECSQKEFSLLGKGKHLICHPTVYFCELSLPRHREKRKSDWKRTDHFTAYDTVEVTLDSSLPHSMLCSTSPNSNTMPPEYFSDPLLPFLTHLCKAARLIF